MKKAFYSFIFIIVFIFAYHDANAQEIYKFRAKYVSFKEYNSYSGWKDWSEWDDINILIVIDTEDQRISIYAKETHTLDIYDSDYSEEGEKNILKFLSIDEDGIKCRARFIYYEDAEERQLYIDYSNFIVVYAVKPMR